MRMIMEKSVQELKYFSSYPNYWYFDNRLIWLFILIKPNNRAHDNRIYPPKLDMVQ